MLTRLRWRRLFQPPGGAGTSLTERMFGHRHAREIPQTQVVPSVWRQSQPRRRSVRKTLALSALFILGLMVLPVVGGAGLYLTLDGSFFGHAGALAGPRLAQSQVEAPAWSGHQRVTILLMGTDHRDSDKNPPRTDVMLVATLDPETRTAGLLSLPRDLWVPIPGYEPNRINAAYELGEGERPGGGPQLARRTVEQFLGVPIQHYALVGFSGFEQAVNQLGGVVVDVPRPLKDDEYPDGDYGLRRIFFQPGLQRLSGETALWYVRSRHADSDFGRARRQQQVLLGLRRQALQLNLIPKIPGIYGALSGAITTDLRANDVVGLARLMKGVDTSHIVNRVVDETMTTHWVTPDGAQVERPDTTKVAALVREVFGQIPQR